ncbi:hypothetical protein ASJ81_04510 [Methanosarcina spelaei]|uniref:Glycosyltransferase RgtA/B/C/D-like domain-containing protein n=1 Tax=Methanosarcina spelaei TaxID=1036679 RepID=A0A2A2HUT6_9EURY|nr:hypothetical protein ASJ81_04510 [Methanosarcina spelaei]
MKFTLNTRKVLEFNRILNPLQNCLRMLVSKHELIFLFTLFFLVYNLNMRSIISGDTLPTSLLPFCILEHHCVNLDSFGAYIETINNPYMFRQIDGHYLSQYPIVTPLIIAPLYLVTYILLKISSCPIDMFNPGFQSIVLLMEKLSASSIASLSCIFVYLSTKNLTNKKIGIISALIYGFGTDTWTISSQALWQHGTVELLLAAMIYITIKNELLENKLNYIFLGFLSGLYILNRPSDSILALPVILYIFLKMNKENIKWFFALVIISGSFLLIYNIYYFGNFLGGYSNLSDGMKLNSEVLSRLVGLLFSPSRGLFTYTPVFLFSVFGYLTIKDLPNEKLRFLLYALGLACILEIMVYSIFFWWWGGHCYGPRYLTGILPVLAIYLGLYMNKVSKKRNKYSKYLIFGLIGIFIIWSLFVQLVGAFYYPMGNWDSKPNVDENPQRLWDWNDTQIMRSFHAGPYAYDSRWILLIHHGIGNIYNKVTKISNYQIYNTNYVFHFFLSSS